MSTFGVATYARLPRASQSHFFISLVEQHRLVPSGTGGSYGSSPLDRRLLVAAGQGEAGTGAKLLRLHARVTAQGPLPGVHQDSPCKSPPLHLSQGKAHTSHKYLASTSLTRIR